MFWKKKQKSFYEFFSAHGETVTKSSKFLREIFESTKNQKALVHSIKKEEHEADNICHDVTKQISSSGFILPIDREDIFNLTKSIEEIVNSIYHVAECYVTIYGLNETTPFAKQFCKAIERLGNLVQLSADAIKTPSHNTEETLKYCLELYAIEHDADNLANEALKDLFILLKNDQVALPDYIAWSDIYRRLEIVTDRGVDFANVIEQIILKYS